MCQSFLYLCFNCFKSSIPCSGAQVWRAGTRRLGSGLSHCACVPRHAEKNRAPIVCEGLYPSLTYLLISTNISSLFPVRISGF